MEFLGQRLRHELKYYIHPHEYLTLRGRVSSFLPLDGFSVGSEGYVIRSLYFDGIHDQALYDKSHGIFSREKYRIRTYNGSDKTIKLERKSKYGEYVSKEAASLTRDEYDRILSGDVSFLATSDKPLLVDFHSAVAHRGFRPAVIVEYTREAYVYGPGDVRITFDKRMAAGINSVDLFDHTRRAALEVIQDSRTIMEVKYNEFFPETVRQLVQPDSHQRSAISKYLLCRETSLQHYKL
ncbi:polyphosphate polymerase domain-containing protein [Cohnella suwonensis]|uniref:Polyphosphate polymerase domain-containing protein n=1 Tax=Cohnella suwonensis TaxID=696072 RepID=A0ABW0LUN4_9BACL